MPHWLVRPWVRLGKQWHEVQRPKRAEQQKHPQHEAEVADAVDDERFLAGVGSGLFQKIETDQQVARKAHALPADEEQHVVRGHHQDQHEKHEQVEVGKETVVPALMRHVSGRVNVDEPQVVEYRARGHQSLSKSTRSTFSVCRLRAIRMMIPRPTAASAAATTITNNTKTWPSSLPCAWLNATNARFTAFSISSMDMKSVMMLRLKMKATTPSPNKIALRIT